MSDLLINPATGKQYFKIDTRAWGDGWTLGYPRLIGISNVFGGIVPGTVDYPGEGVKDDGAGNLVDSAGEVVGSVDYASATLTINQKPAEHARTADQVEYQLAFTRAGDGQRIWHGINYDHPNMVARSVRLGP